MTVYYADKEDAMREFAESKTFYISQSTYDGNYAIFYAWHHKHDAKQFDTTVAIFKIKIVEP